MADHYLGANISYKSVGNRTFEVTITAYQDEDHPETSIEEQTGILRALCTKENMSIDDGMSDLLSSQLHVLSSSAKMTNIVNDLRSELSRISSISNIYKYIYIYL